MLVLTSPGVASAQAGESPDGVRVGLFDDFGTNLGESFIGTNLLWHGLAIGSTVTMSATGADDEIQRFFWRESILGHDVTQATFVAGWFTPAVIPGVMALGGLAADDDELVNGGVVALQAVTINLLVTQLLKFATGRPLPYEDGRPSDGGNAIFDLKRSDSGRDWSFFGGGVAWPSGHTSAHMALASSLVAFYPDEEWLPFVAYPIVALVALAMVEGDHHWASDVVAGALIGHAVGWTVGSNARRRVDAARAGEGGQSRLTALPLASGDTFMLTLSFGPF